MSTQQDGEFKSENTTDTRQTEDIKSHKPETNPKDNFSLKSTIRPVRVKRTSEQETIRKTVISAELQHGTEKAHDKEQFHRKSKIAVLKPGVKQRKSSHTSVVSKEHQGSERDQCNVERRIHFSDEHENKGETRKETPRSNDAVKKTLRDKREHFRLSRSSNNSDKVSGSTSPLSDVLSIENKSSATIQGREEIPLRNLSNGSKSLIGSDKKETFHDSILKERDESKTHRRAKYPPDNNEKTQTQTRSEHIRQVSTSIKDSRKSTSDASKGDKRTFKQPFAKQFLTADIVSPEIERSKSEQRIQNQSSTETSGLGETITSGFSSQESIASVQSYQTSSKTAPEIYSHLTFQEDLGIDLREDTTRGETKDNDSFETETIDSQNVINGKNELGNYRENIKSRFINKSGPSHSTSDGLFHVDILEREILDKPICYRPMKEQVEQHQIHFLGPTDQLNNNGASQKQGIEPIPSQEVGNLEQEGSYHVVTDFDELFQQSENLPQQTMGLGIEQINNEWNRHTRSSSIKSIRSNRSSQGSFRSRSGSTRRSKRFLGEKESKWMKWGRERRASFRRRLDKLEQPEPEVPPRPSTPIKKARQEGLMFIHPDLESKYISEEDINYIQRHRQQRLQTYKVIEKSKNIRFHQDSIGLGRLTANDLNILTRFWEHRVFVRSRYISILLSFITVVIYIISICSSNWIIYPSEDAKKNKLMSRIKLGVACLHVSKTFTRQHNLFRHVKEVHQKMTYICLKCNKSFSRRDKLHQHESNCQGIVAFPCNLCDIVLKTAWELEFHQKIKHEVKLQKRQREKSENEPPTKRQRQSSPQPGPSSASGPSTYRCRRCPAQFPDRQALHAHQVQRHYQVGGGLHPEPFQREQEPWVNEDRTVNEGLRDCYQTNRSLILERYREGPVESLYNIPMYPGMTIFDIGQALQGIYDRQSHAFKKNLSFGFIMRHVETGRFRYFRPYDNVNFFDEPILNSRRSDIGKVLKKLRTMDVMAEISKSRPNTKWKLVLLTNIRCKVYNTNFSLGYVERTPLQEYISRCKAIISLDKDPVNKKAYNDNLCVFRCLCLHLNGSVDKAQVLALYNQWERLHDQREYVDFFGGRTTTQVEPPNSFLGLQLQDLPEFEQCFEMNVQMYSLQEDGAVVQVFKPTERYPDTMYVNQHENHCSYITDFANYAKRFKCQLCDRMFDHHGNFRQHSKICDKKTVFDFPGGFYQGFQTVFELLEEFNIHVPRDERMYPWFAVFDFESMLLKLEGDATEKIEWTQQHVPISVSVCSNVPEHTQPLCFIHPDMDPLVEQMVDALNQIQRSASGLAQQKWGRYLDLLNERLEHLNDENEEDRKEEERVKKLFGQLKGYMTTLPVLGFNR